MNVGPHNTIDSELAEDEVFVFPVSFAQQRLWFLDQFEPNSPFYNIPLAVRLRGPLDVSAFQQALNGLVERHETLRTTFGSVDNQPVQLIAPSGTLAMPLEDLSQLPPAERERESQRLAVAEARQPFNLSTGPLVRARLLRLSPSEHIALLTLHHIIADGWSMGVLVAEVAALYQAFANGRPSPLPPLPIQYADFAEWQRDWLAGETLENQLSFWKEHLGSHPPVLELATDRPRPPVQTSNGATLARTLPRPLADALHELGRREGATLFMTLLTAWNVLLMRYSGQDDICVGTPIANRTRPEIEGLIGFFVNTLVLRSVMHGEPSFRELLRRTRETALGAFAHQDLPFEMLVEALQPERDMSRNPLFQVMFILQNTPVKLHQLPGMTMEQLDVDSGISTFDLTLMMTEGRDGLDASLEYNTDLFEAATIERMLGHLHTLLESIVATPDAPITRLPLLSEAETRQLAAWSYSPASYDASTPVYRLFEAWAERTPEAAAIADWPDKNAEAQRRRDAERLTGDRRPETGAAQSSIVNRQSSISYHELNQRANQLAHHLRTLGVARESVVGICMEKSPELLLAVLAVWKAGGAYLPLDPNYPAERLAWMVEDAKPAVILTQEPRTKNQEPAESPYADGSWFSVLGSQYWLASISGLPSPVNVSDWKQFAHLPTTNPNLDVAPGDLAYLIYTSGSTGRPRGVMVTHGNLANAALAWAQEYRLQPDDVHVQMASFSFDVFAGDLARALATGGSLVLCPRDLLLEPAELHRLIQTSGVTCAEFVPAVLRLLLGHLEATGERLSGMRLLACGSDSWYVGEYRAVQRQLGSQTRLINSFGLTEATIDSTYFESTELALAADQHVPIGRPFPGTTVAILDAHMQPVPIGVPGELYIGGAGVARGYLNKPELTAERFLDFGFWMLDFGLDADQSTIQNLKSKIYKSGDRARWLPDGNIAFLGRADTQVKIRGYRVEPGEIESLLLHHPAVREAAVVARDDRLVAYVVLQEPRTKNQEPASAQDGSWFSVLGSFLREKLPDYMVPSTIVELAALPLTPNGKVDRRALPAPEWTVDEAAEGFVAPRTAVETQLAALWGAVLGLESVSVHGNFFSLGGHSLLATQLVARVRATFAIEMPLRVIFESPTLAELAERVELAQRGGAVQLPPISPADRTQPLPLSFAQQRLWFLDQLEPNSPFYNMPEALRLRGPLDLPRLEGALAQLVARHESLRTSFVTVGGVPQQVIAPAAPVSIPLTDLTHLPPDEREAAARQLAQLEAAQPFNLANGPLWRCAVARLAPNDHMVLLTVHHIISDDWSSTVLMGEIAALYGGQALPPLPIHYADYAAWQRANLQGEMLARHVDFWKNHLTGAPPLLELPTDRPRPSVQSFTGSYRPFALPPATAQGLRALAQREGATPFMTLLAAFQVLLMRYSGQDDIVVGTPIANRSRPELEGLIGFFVNTLALRGDLRGEPSFRQLLRQVRETALNAYAHQDMPFEMVVDAVQPERNLSHSPLFQAMFVLNNTPPQRSAVAADLLIEAVAAHSGTAKFDLTLFLVEDGDGLSGAFEYCSALFDASTIERMVGHFTRLLESIVATPDTAITRLPLLSAAELHQQLVEWNDTAVPLPAASVHQLFEAVAARMPDAIAVTEDGRPETGATQSPPQPPRMQGGAGQSPIANRQSPISYRELNARANQLAHHLRSLGVGPDVLVALCMERSPELLIAILAVLKAGGAYVPLDPGYPAERLRYMIEDGQPKVVIVDCRLQIADWLTEIAAANQSTIYNLQAAMQSQLPTENLALETTPEQLAYVIYTSGSTGRPKGAMITQRGLVNYLTWAVDFYHVAEGNGAPVQSSIAFDLTVTSVLAPLLAGRPVELLPEGADATELGERLRAQPGYSLVKITPAHLELVSQQLAPHEAAGGAGCFVIGGEQLRAETLNLWREHAPATRLVNEYGPTETVVGCCVYEVQPGDPTSGAVPIGRPIQNTQLYVLDAAMQPVPVGVIGDLYIGGAGVGRGYLNRPELTAERFLDFGLAILDFGLSDSASQSHIQNLKSKIYKTGDRARYRPDGVLEYLGRADDQVKIRGFRIELGEIEAVLAEHPAVADVAVVVREDTPGVKRLVAYVVPGKNAETQRPRDAENNLVHVPDSVDSQSSIVNRQSSISTSQSPISNLQERLRQRLPDHMVPTAIVELDALPLTPNGKVDRRRLPAPEGEAPRAGGPAYVAPRTPTEQTLAAIWSEVLGLAQVGVDDNFFSLGGDSILSIQVIARAQAAGLALTPRQLFEAPTVAGLSVLATPLEASHADSPADEEFEFDDFGWSEDDVSAILDKMG